MTLVLGAVWFLEYNVLPFCVRTVLLGSADGVASRYAFYSLLRDRDGSTAFRFGKHIKTDKIWVFHEMEWILGPDVLLAASSLSSLLFVPTAHLLPTFLPRKLYPFRSIFFHKVHHC
jgi:hypothetical protein